jgi:hypothetical protein
VNGSREPAGNSNAVSGLAADANVNPNKSRKQWRLSGPKTLFRL